MPELPTAVESNIPFLALLGIAVFAVGFAYWHYRSVTPRISNMKRRLLMALRFITFISLLLIFIKPNITLIFQREIKPQISVYVDNSLSMSINNESEQRWEQTIQVLNILENLSIEKRWLFNTRVYPLTDSSFTVSKDATNFEALFQHIDSKSADNVIIISDGNVTEGSYPVQLKQHPDKKVFTVGVGRKENNSELFIENVSYEPLVYKGIEQNIGVKIGTQNLKKGFSASVKLMHKGAVLAVKSFRVDTLDAFHSIVFNNTPQSVGRIKFKVILENYKADVNKRNNSFHFVQQVLKKKQQIAIFTGLPGYESKFLNQLLSAEQDFDCRFFAENKQGRFSGQVKPDLKTHFDVLVLQNFPGPFTRQRTLIQLAQILKKRKSSLFLMLGEKTDLTKLNQILEFTPFEQLPKKMRPETSLSFNPGNSTILDLFNNSDANSQFWQQIPPIEILFAPQKLKPGTKILLSGNKHPLIISYCKPGFRNITFGGSGFWRWHFLMQNNSALANGYKNLLKHSIRWLADKQSIKPVQLKADAREIVPGKILHLNGFIYDADFKAVTDGEFQLAVRQGMENIDLNAVMDSSGRFSAEFVPGKEGTLQFTAKGFRFGRLYGQDKLQIEVAAAEKEFIHSGLNRRYLQQIAKESGGMYVDAAQTDSLIKHIPREIIVQKEKQTIALWHNPYLLALILLSIISEWILRRRFGLV